MVKFDFLYSILSACSLEELEELKEIVCKEIEKRIENFRITVKAEPQDFVETQFQPESDNYVLETDPETANETQLNVKLEDPKSDEKEFEKSEQINFQIPDSSRRNLSYSEPGPYKCKFCEKTFKNIRLQAEHARIHNDEKPFSCQFCGKGFLQKRSQKKHEKLHTDGKIPEGEGLSYTCLFCPRIFANKTERRIHERSHTKPFKCQFCDQTFVSKQTRKFHEMNHTGEEKPFKCQFCDKTFVSNFDKVAFINHVAKKVT